MKEDRGRIWEFWPLLKEDKVMKLNIDTGHLLFMVDCLGCALKLSVIDRIINFSSVDIVSIPGSRAFIEGVTEYNKQVLPIYNVKRWLHFHENVYKDREWVIIIIKVDNEQYGLLVDNVVAIATSEMRQEKNNIDDEVILPIEKKWIKEIIWVNDHPFVSIKLDKMFLGEE